MAGQTSGATTRTTSLTMATNALGEHIKGLKAAKAAFQALPEIVRENLLHATEVTVREIARGAQSRLLSSPSVQTRNLYNAVAWSVTKTNGRGKVGITRGQTILSSLATRKRIKVKGIVVASKSGAARVDQPSRRAHFIEFGTRHQPAEPFMLPSAESQVQPYVQRCHAAGKDIERDVAAVGTRTL